MLHTISALYKSIYNPVLRRWECGQDLHQECINEEHKGENSY